MSAEDADDAAVPSVEEDADAALLLLGFAAASEQVREEIEEEDMDMQTADDILDNTVTSGTKKGYMTTLKTCENYLREKFPAADPPVFQIGSNPIERFVLPMQIDHIKSYLGSLSYNK